MLFEVAGNSSPFVSIGASEMEPHISSSIELPHPGSKNTFIHQLPFKGCFYLSSRCQ